MEVAQEKKLELINKIGFFSRFDEADKITLAGLATFAKYQPGERLITQNTSNTHLFFIINGSVDVLIDNNQIVQLFGGGHVFGEISFVDSNPASASVVANSKVVAMLFDTTQINLMDEPIYYKLRLDIYRSCAEVMAKRLIHANAIAKTHNQNVKTGDLIFE